LSSTAKQAGNAPNVRVITEAPAAVGPNISVPITVSVEPADNEFASIRAALGEYGVTALTASVDGPEFNLSPTEAQVTQWVNEERLQWTWVASAKSTGEQTLRITLNARGKPEWSTELVEGQIWSGLMQVSVEAPASGGFDLGNIDLLGPLNTLAGLGLSIPWFLEQIKGRKQEKAGAKSEVKETAPAE
jgi:hypothetical protein